jgi:hypothetical protein
MKVKGRRQSTNVTTATPKDYAQGEQNWKGASNRTLRSQNPISAYPIDPSNRTGALEIDDGSNDHPFLQHFQKDN